MKKHQKEVIQSALRDEEAMLKELKKSFMQAARDCSEKIAQFNAKIEMNPSNLQSLIYQKEYQEAILLQLNEILADLNATQYESVHAYLEQCYTNGYLGAMYDLNLQGIPIIVPIDQRNVVRALTVDSKLSKGLYERLGEDIGKLKTAIRRELSRGIANGSSWTDVAYNLSQSMNSPFRTAMNNSMRIVRTEGGRIQSQAQMEACQIAKDRGATIVKQWDATLDDRTRESHQMVDGEIRDIDDPFSNGLMYPRDPKGDPEEVINCRCAMLQRAEWNLDQDELNTLQDRANFYGLDKTENFEQFKETYLNIS